MKLISFVIPVYRNEKALTITYNKIKELLNNNLRNYNYEFVFVDDGSDDNSLNELLELRQHDANVKVIEFSRNFGQMAAIVAGLREAKGDAIVNMSADLQDPVELIKEMVEAWENAAEIVIGFRIGREDSLAANLSSKAFYSLMNLSLPNLPRGGFDYVLLGRKAVDAYNKLQERNRFYQGDILWLGFPVKFIPYQRIKRTIGKSQWTFSKKLKSFIDSILVVSYWPIRLMTIMGLIVSFLGFLYALVITFNRFNNNTPFTGWAPIMILILVIGGIIMMMLGVIGEYLWRIYDETRGRPMYIINEKHV